MKSNQSQVPELQSAIYSGWVEHLRYKPKEHQFRYKVFMMYLDLDELEQVFNLSKLWSMKHKFAPACFRRSDFFGDSQKNLKQEIFDRIEQETGEVFEGSVRVLTNLRYFGYIVNPITCYYCFNQQEQLSYVLAEVTNTPWEQRTAYLIPCDTGKPYTSAEFEKNLHVSPFNPMHMHYLWYSNTPDKQLLVNLDVLDKQGAVMSAHVMLKREEISARKLNLKLIQYPLMTVKVVSAIYWQAMKLFLKKVPLFQHPDKQQANLKLEQEKQGTI